MNREKVIVAYYPGCLSFEVKLATEFLSERYQVLNATPNGADLTDADGFHLQAHLSYVQVNLVGCRAVLVPGGDPESIIYNGEIDRILIGANEAGLLMGGICAGPSVLGKAGVLNGRKIAHGYGKEQLECLQEIFKGAILTDEQFVVDGNIITAKPNAYIDFAIQIASLLGVVDPSQCDQLRNYYIKLMGR